MNEKSKINQVINYLRAMRYEDLPRELVELICQDLLDFCGNTLAGSGDPAVEKTWALCSEWGGKPECTVLVHGNKLPAVNAVMVNGAMSFAMDCDDTHIPAGHVGVTVFPAGLAAAEMIDKLSGKDFIVAVAAGMELNCRLGACCVPRISRHIFGGWCYQTLHACFSSAVTASLVLGLGEKKLMDAMGLAHHLASGTGLAAFEHADSKILGPGFGGRNGMTSVLMAKKGLTGAHYVLEGDYGLGNLVHNGFDFERFTANLGTYFEMLNIGFKPYASCRLGHRTLDAVSRLIKEHDIQAADVDRVEIRASERVIEQLYEPTEKTKHPDHRTGAVFSLPWVVSSILHFRKVGVAELSQEALENKSVHNLAQRVFAEVDHTVDPSDHAAPMSVTVVMINGKRLTTKTNPIGPGDLGNRISQEDMEAKFYDNASHCVKPHSDADLKKLVDAISNLEKVENMREIITLMS